MTSLENKCSIIEEFMRNFSFMPETYNNQYYLDFKIYNDLGVPLAQAFEYNLIKFEKEGEELINETWINFCNMLEVDPDEEYKSLLEIIPQLNEDS